MNEICSVPPMDTEAIARIGAELVRLGSIPKVAGKFYLVRDVTEEFHQNAMDAARTAAMAGDLIVTPKDDNGKRLARMGRDNMRKSARRRKPWDYP